jgi:uncharacterized protein YndB with AHSA1/START domain
VIVQTAQFMGATAAQLYKAYLSSAEHARMTVNGTLAATFHRPTEGDVATGRAGDELRAFGMPGSDGQLDYSLHAKILELVPNRLIVLSWKNKVWDLALDADDRTELASTVILTFADNFAGAEIRLSQVNVPNYKVKVPDTVEVGPLSEIVNAHWTLLYWEPMRRYVQQQQPAARPA